MRSTEFGRRGTEEHLANIPVIEVRGLTKRFPGVTALDRVNLSIHPGEVHTILGENGAGKTTLMNILYGLYRPDEGEILIKNQAINHYSPQEAIQAGIGMVHQDFRLVPSLTVAENIILGDRTQPFWLTAGSLNDQIEALSKQYGLAIDPNERVANLPVGLQQRVAILKALHREAQILILDEPTSVLTPQETEVLFVTLTAMKEQGKTIVFITHKLAEALTIADRITVLRQGERIDTVEADQVDQNQLATMMVGSEIDFDIPKPEVLPGEVVLSLEGVFTEKVNGKGLNGVSFQLKRGEILGIAGVAGNGQTELAEVVTGLREISEGEISIDLGLAHIPEDRRGMGVAEGLPVGDNLILRRFRQPPYTSKGRLNKGAISDLGERLIQRFNIATPGLETPVSALSGGNLQRVIVAREIDSSQGILVANLPTQGLDVAATASLRRLLVKQQSAGQAVLLISQDLDEIMTLSDQIGVMFAGKMFGPFPRNQVSKIQIGLLMTGVNSKWNPTRKRVAPLATRYK